MRRPFPILFALVCGAGLGAGLGGCQTVIDGPTRLMGQDLDAATALYGPWNDRADLDGRQTYIWRRTLIHEGKPYMCELRVQLGFRNTIGVAYLEGIPEACHLFAVKTESMSH